MEEKRGTEYTGPSQEDVQGPEFCVVPPNTNMVPYVLYIKKNISGPRKC